MPNGYGWPALVDEFARRAHRELRVTLAKPLAPEKWVFVVGCYNSGTTLIADVIGRHPLIGDLPDEGQYLTDQLLVDYKIGLPRMWVEREDLFRMDETSRGPDVQRMRKEWAIRVDKRDAPLMLEKTPANMARTRWLQANFPNAHFIGVIRDPYAVAAGIRKKAEPEHRREGWPIEMCARQWARSNRVLEEDSRSLSRFMWLRYEDFSEHPREALEQVNRFLGVPDSGLQLADQQFDIHERRESIRNLNPESIRDLSAQDIAAINAVAAEDIRHFGYPLLGPLLGAGSDPAQVRGLAR